MANGTATEPIIFTTTADQITNDHPNYPGLANLSVDQKGLWGGLIVLDTPISADASEIQIEGIMLQTPTVFTEVPTTLTIQGLFAMYKSVMVAHC